MIGSRLYPPPCASDSISSLRRPHCCSSSVGMLSLKLEKFLAKTEQPVKLDLVVAILKDLLMARNILILFYNMKETNLDFK
jgi:hypothetical protein